MQLHCNYIAFRKQARKNRKLTQSVFYGFEKPQKQGNSESAVKTHNNKVIMNKQRPAFLFHWLLKNPETSARSPHPAESGDGSGKRYALTYKVNLKTGVLL